MARSLFQPIITLLAIAAVALGTLWAVRRLHTPGQLDVVTAQAMDMSAMRPPTGAAPVALAAVRRGTVGDTVTYTATVRAYNEQDISPRITGVLTALPLYPGDRVRAGQVVARLDTAEVGAKADTLAATARQAQAAARTAGLVQTLQRQAATEQAAAQAQVAASAITQAQGEAQAAADAIADAKAGVQSAAASTAYWKIEIVRERQLVDAGAVSRQEYQSEVSQAQAADAALAQARAKQRQSTALAAAARAKVAQAQRGLAAAQAGQRVAQADAVVAGGQAAQQDAAAAAAQAAAREAATVRGYSQIMSPADGVVTARPVAPGTLVQPGTVILRIAEIGRVRVQASVAATDLARVQVGTPVSIALQSGGAKPIMARVTALFPSADDQTRTAIVEATVRNPGGRLLPGMFATMHIRKPGGSAGLLVPAPSVVTDGGGSFVWVAQGGGGAASAAPTRYQCEKCHMIYSAADAKKNHYIDPMDGGTLTPLPPSASTGGALTAHRVAVQVGASDGTWTQVASDALADTSRVVAHGQAGLVEGAALAPTAWGTDGPRALPTATAPTTAKPGVKMPGMSMPGMKM